MPHHHGPTAAVTCGHLPHPHAWPPAAHAVTEACMGAVHTCLYTLHVNKRLGDTIPSAFLLQELILVSSFYADTGGLRSAAHGRAASAT